MTAYTKTQWTNDSEPAVNADNLNHIENGLYDATSAITALQNAGYTTQAQVEQMISDSIGVIENGSY